MFDERPDPASQVADHELGSCQGMLIKLPLYGQIVHEMPP